MSEKYEKLHRFHGRIREKSRKSVLNMLFGRSALIILMLAVQIILMLGLFMRWQYASFAYGGSYVLGLFMALHLINKPMNTSARQTWLIVILLAPIFGTALYAFVDMDIGHRLVRRELEQIEKRTRNILPVPRISRENIMREDPSAAGLAKYLYDHGGFQIYANTNVAYYPTGEESISALLDELEHAQKFIFIEFFIIDEGMVWDSVLEILKRKVAEGVEVRVMYDGTDAVFRLPYKYPEKLRAMGIQCKMFSPLRPLVSTHYNNRDHRKIVVIDGQVAFTGGVNLADEYINATHPHGYWKDNAILLKGEAVRSFTLMFLRMWNVFERGAEYASYLNAPLASVSDASGYVIPYGDSPFDDERVGETVYLDIINRAERYVHIMTPYLIIDAEMTQALTTAAKRGVDVRLILPHIPDKKTAFALAHTHYRELLAAGVRIYEFVPGFVHAKTFVSDDKKAVVGTINLDYRSLYLHFECAAYMLNMPTIARIEEDYQHTLKDCEQITIESLKKDRWPRRLLGYLLKVFAPLM